MVHKIHRGKTTKKITQVLSVPQQKLSVEFLNLNDLSVSIVKNMGIGTGNFLYLTTNAPFGLHLLIVYAVRT